VNMAELLRERARDRELEAEHRREFETTDDELEAAISFAVAIVLHEIADAYEAQAA
jgi:hypothetical protein